MTELEKLEIACVKLFRFFSPFLIPAPAADTDQHLTAAAFGVMNMPVVSASRLEAKRVQLCEILDKRGRICYTECGHTVCRDRYSPPEI